MEPWQEVMKQLMPINNDMCSMLHTHNIGLPLFTNRNLMRLYLTGYRRGKMDGPITLGFERVRQVYKKYKIELDTLARAAFPDFVDDWLEHYINNTLGYELGEEVFSL